MPHSLLLVCDDAGFACVDRGIRMLAERTGLPLCAEYLIECDGAVQRAREMAQIPNVPLGLHFELSGITDAERVLWTHRLLEQGRALGEEEEVQRKASDDARRQLAVFRDALGKNPAHISTHGNFNADVHGHVMPWWHELMGELFDDKVPPMQLSMPIIRHNLYSWCKPETPRQPCAPEEFECELATFAEYDAVEFVMHPALPQLGDASLDMLFTAEMRVADLEAAIQILNSDAIDRCGFVITPVASFSIR